MKYLKKFFTQNEYGEFVDSDKFIKPHVSYITENKKVNFHKKIRKPVEPEGNTILTAGYYASEETRYAALFNDCGIKSLKIDGVPVEREFPKPIIQTVEVTSENLQFITDESGTTTMQFTGEYRLAEGLAELCENSQEYFQFGAEVYLRPKNGTIKDHNVTAILMCSTKENKGAAFPLETASILGIVYDEQKDAYIVDMASNFQGMSIYSLYLPSCFSLASMDNNNELTVIDTIEEIIIYKGNNIYDEATSSTTPTIMFDSDGEHTLEIELYDNKIPPIMFANTCITGISCNQKLESIGAGAFTYTLLMDVNLNDVCKIESSAFHYCPLLSNVNFLQNTYQINSGVFMECYSLESITLPEKLAILGPGILEKSPVIKQIVFQGKIAPRLITDGDQLTNFFFASEGPTNPVTVHIPKNADMASYNDWITVFNNAEWPIIYY